MLVKEKSGVSDITLCRQKYQRELDTVEKYWRAANFLGAAQLYLKDNFLLAKPLLPEHIKDRLLGHWGTVPGINLIYAHLNRLIKAMILIFFLLLGQDMEPLLIWLISI